MAWEGPGLIAAEAQARGLHPDIRRLDLGAGVPQPDDVEGLVVMGGPMGVYATLPPSTTSKNLAKMLLPTCSISYPHRAETFVTAFL